MIGRSGSSAGSWVAASQSLRIGRWRCGAGGVCIGGGLRSVARMKSATPARRMPRFWMRLYPRQHPLAEGAHLGEYAIGLGPLEIEIDRRDPEIAQRADVADEIGVSAGEKPALAVGGLRRHCVAIALDAV